MIRFMWELVCKPTALAGALVWAIFGTYKGTAVQDDYTWIIGAIVLVGGIVLQSRILKMGDRLDALEKEQETLKKNEP